MVTKLGAGSIDGDFARWNAATSSWAAVPSPHHKRAFRAYQSVAQTLTKNAWNKLTFTTEDFDLDSVFASSTYTPGQVGYYLVGGAYTLASAEDGARHYLAIFKNGGETIDLATTYVGAAGNPLFSGCALIYLSSVTDYLELYAHHANSVNKDTIAATNTTYFWGFEM